MDSTDQWYYVEGGEARGPVPSAQIAQMIRAGVLEPGTQVAQAGWQQWSPASLALSHLLGPAGHAEPPPPTAPVYAIKVHCVSGPDAGKAYMIGAPEVSVGRVSGIGETDPQVAQVHVVLSWQDNLLLFRTFAGAVLKVDGAGVTQGTLSNGQHFQLGASVWQVGAAPVELGSFIGSLAARLSRLASSEKLEGFSLGPIFSEMFKPRKPGELEDYFSVGTVKTTPPLDQVQTGWPKPWFFMRVLGFMLVLYFVLSKTIGVFGNPRMIPGLMAIGSLAVPLAALFLFWELNTPRNVSFVYVLMLMCLGGVISLFATHVAGDVANFGWLGHISAGIGEEAAKLLVVVLVVRNVRYKYTLNGIVFGAAVGCGFAVLETAGYALSNGFLREFVRFLTAHVDTLQALNPKDTDALSEIINAASQNGYPAMFGLIDFRSFLSPFSHIAWTAITAGALWRVKGASPMRLKMLIDPGFLRTFLVAVALHIAWDAPLFRSGGVLYYAKYPILGVIAWYGIFLLVQQGLLQIRDAQLAEARTDLDQTQEILTTTGRFRAQETIG
jgi:protease PrsW